MFTLVSISAVFSAYFFAMPPCLPSSSVLLASARTDHPNPTRTPPHPAHPLRPLVSNPSHNSLQLRTQSQPSASLSGRVLTHWCRPAMCRAHRKSVLCTVEARESLVAVGSSRAVTREAMACLYSRIFSTCWTKMRLYFGLYFGTDGSPSECRNGGVGYSRKRHYAPPCIRSSQPMTTWHQHPYWSLPTFFRTTVRMPMT